MSADVSRLESMTKAERATELVRLREWEVCLDRPCRPTGLPQDDDLPARDARREAALADVRVLIKHLS